MGLFEIISLVLNLVLGGGLLHTFLTLKSVRAEAEASAETAKAGAKRAELDNVEAAIKLWREMAEKMADDRSVLATQVEELSTEVRRLKNATNRVVRMLDKMTAENMAETIHEIKQEIDNEYTDVSGNIAAIVSRVQDATSSSARSAGKGD